MIVSTFSSSLRCFSSNCARRRAAASSSAAGASSASSSSLSLSSSLCSNALGSSPATLCRIRRRMYSRSESASLVAAPSVGACTAWSCFRFFFGSGATSIALGASAPRSSLFIHDLRFSLGAMTDINSSNDAPLFSLGCFLVSLGGATGVSGFPAFFFASSSSSPICLAIATDMRDVSIYVRSKYARAASASASDRKPTKPKRRDVPSGRRISLTSVTVPFCAKCSRSRASVKYVGSPLTIRRDMLRTDCDDAGQEAKKRLGPRAHGLCHVI